MPLLRLAAFGAVAYGALALAGREITRRSEPLRPDQAPRPGRVVDVDGVGLHIIEAGSGPAALLIHGLGGNTFSFRETLPALAPRFRVVAVDLAGFGYSERDSARDHSLDAHAALLAKLIEQEGMAPALLLGHSNGGAIAMRLAARRPELVERLVLVASTEPNRMRRGGPLRKLLLQPLRPLVSLGQLLAAPLSRLVLRGMVHDRSFVTPAVRAGYDRPRQIRGSSDAYWRLFADSAHDAPIDLQTLHVPTLLLWGKQDRVVPLSTGERLLERIPDARLEVIDRAGHLPLEEQPAAANAALLHWLEETQGAAHSGGATI